ncbi:MAG: amino acid permease [bacterium]
MTDSETQVQLGRYLGLFEATMIGVGAMIGAGIFVLTGLAAGNAGPAALFAFGLNGVVTLFTALSYAELASAIPEAGGGYSFVKKVMPNTIAFMSGWMLWFAYVVACSLYAKGFGSYFVEFFDRYVPSVINPLLNVIGHELTVVLLTVTIGGLFVGINILGSHASGQTENVMTIAKIVILSIFILYGLRAIYFDPRQTYENFTPLLPLGVGGVVSAMGLTFIAFEGYDLIATVSEEVIEPEETIPKAILYSLGITIAIYLLVVFVSIGAVPPEDGVPTWKMLGNYGEIGIVRAAGSFMPRFGVILVLGGGVFATLSALNATILASSRVAFSMGRDWMLPNVLSKIHSSRRTPVAAILVSGVLFLTMAVFFPLETIGTASSLLFLLTFGFVNYALIRYRNRHQGETPSFQVPFYPLTPILGLLTCLGLAGFQLYHAPAASLISVFWIVLGYGIYQVFFSTRAEISDIPTMMESVELRSLKKVKPYRLLVSVADPGGVEPLVTFGGLISRSSGGDMVGMSVVDLPDVTAYSEANPFLDKAQKTLNHAQELALKKDVDFSSIMKIGRQVGSEIMATARETNADLILMGYKKASDPLENSIIKAVAEHQPCDLAILKHEGTSGTFDRILVPVEGKEIHDRLKSRLLHGFKQECDSHVTFLYVQQEGSNQKSRTSLKKTLNHQKNLYDLPDADTLIVDNDDTAEAIKNSADRHDLVVLGARQVPWFESFFFGSLNQRVIEGVDCPVLLTKAFSHQRSLIRRWFGDS